MNELNISSLIQIMQEGFVEHDKQESAGRFLLESVALQEDSLCTTDLNSKKISRLVNRKDPVPDDIKQAALKADIAVKVEEYFRFRIYSIKRYCKVLWQVIRKNLGDFVFLLWNTFYFLYQFFMTKRTFVCNFCQQRWLYKRIHFVLLI